MPLNKETSLEDFEEIWALKQSIGAMNTKHDIAKKQSKMLLVLGALCLVIPFVMLLVLKLEPLSWIAGFSCGVGAFFLQLGITSKNALAVSKHTKQYVKIEEMKRRLVELET